MDDPWRLHDRVRWMSRGALALFALLGARALQVQTGAPAARPVQVRERAAPARGRVLDAHGAVLAEDVPSHEVDADPRPLRASPAAVDRLAAALGVPAAPLHERVAWLAANGSRVMRVQRRVDDATAARIRREARALPGVWLTAVTARRYPEGALAMFPVGYMGDPGPGDMVEPLGYRLGDRMGRAGVERSWDLTLRGTSTLAPERQGMTLVTSLDLGLQRAAAAALGEQSGAALALDPRDGRVLAYVSRPAADPGAFERGAVADLAAVLLHPGFPLVDRVADLPSAPGRPLAAPFLIANALAHGIDPAAVDRGNRPYPWGFALREFGFGRPTGVDLRDESGGGIRDGGPDPAFIATPLQVGVAYAALANGGTVYQPRLVDRVLHPDGTVASRTTPVVSGHVQLPRVAVDRVLAVMRGLFAPEGSLHPLADPSLDVGAVASEVHDAGLGMPTYRPRAWFVGLAPSAAPRVVVVVMVERAERDLAARAGLALLRSWQTSDTERRNP